MNGSRSLRRLWRHPYVVVAAVLLFAAGLTSVGVTFASFTAETQNNTSTFAGGWLSPATALAVSPTGYNAALAWSPGRHGLDGQQLYGVDNGTSSSCPASIGSYSSLATMASATTASYTESSTTIDNPRSNVNGHYVCYRMLSTRSGSSWTATASFPATVLGLAPVSVAIAYTTYFNNRFGTATLAITYNQSVAYTGPATFRVCLAAGPPFTLTLGSSGSCTAGIGTFSGGSDGGTTYNCTTSSAAASGNTLTVTLGGCPAGAAGHGVLSGSATYTATGATVASSVGSVPQCTTTVCQISHTYP